MTFTFKFISRCLNQLKTMFGSQNISRWRNGRTRPMGVLIFEFPISKLLFSRVVQRRNVSDFLFNNNNIFLFESISRYFVVSRLKLEIFTSIPLQTV
jgi:hypothetical protein